MQLPYAALYTLTWVILNEDFSWLQIFIGFIFSIVVITFTKSTLLTQEYRGLYRINLFRLVLFFLKLIPLMYKSGLTAIRRIIRGQDSVCILHYASSLDDDLDLALLANGITLTPGTVTLSITGSDLEIMSFEPLPGSSKSDLVESIRKIENNLGGSS